MNVVIAIDSFKGSMTSLEAGESASAGIRRIYPDADITIRPLADGGEGTVDALTLGCGGTCTQVCVTGPLGKPVLCSYGILDAGKTAVIEMSGAAGITLLSETERNPLYTTTYGVGEVIRDAIARGCRHFIIGIGGSATNDGGIGMLQALGFDLLDQEGVPVRHGALGLKDLAVISDSHALPELKECTFRIACDVTNPLCGSQGCSAVFGPQKGADPAMIQQMDQWLSSTFFHATLESGVNIILEETHLSDYIKNADIVITGEGCLDGQTVMGKAPVGVAKIAREFQKPVLAFSGCVTEDAKACHAAGIDAFFPIVRGVISLEDAMQTDHAKQNMTDTVEQVFRMLRTFQNTK